MEAALLKAQLGLQESRSRIAELEARIASQNHLFAQLNERYCDFVRGCSAILHVDATSLVASPVSPSPLSGLSNSAHDRMCVEMLKSMCLREQLAMYERPLENATGAIKPVRNDTAILEHQRRAQSSRCVPQPVDSNLQYLLSRAQNEIDKLNNDLQSRNAELAITRGECEMLQRELRVTSLTNQPR